MSLGVRGWGLGVGGWLVAGSWLLVAGGWRLGVRGWLRVAVGGCVGVAWGGRRKLQARARGRRINNGLKRMEGLKRMRKRTNGEKRMIRSRPFVCFAKQSVVGLTSSPAREYGFQCAVR